MFPVLPNLSRRICNRKHDSLLIWFKTECKMGREPLIHFSSGRALWIFFSLFCCCWSITGRDTLWYFSAALILWVEAERWQNSLHSVLLTETAHLWHNHWWLHSRLYGGFAHGSSFSWVRELFSTLSYSCSLFSAHIGSWNFLFTTWGGWKKTVKIWAHLWLPPDL